MKLMDLRESFTSWDRWGSLSTVRVYAEVVFASSTTWEKKTLKHTQNFIDMPQDATQNYIEF